MRAADLIARSFEAHGVTRAYCVPGESYLALLDALHDSTVKVVVCRHESGAGFMAVGEAKMTGRAGVFMVSRGPGATNGSIAVHVAEQDATPLVVIIGQVARDERGRGAFQEMDYTQVFGSVAKGVFEVHDAGRIGETLARAFHLAESGVPGPVVISVPEDMLRDETDVPLPAPYPVHRPQHSAQHAVALQELIDQAERPILLAGSALRGTRGAAALARFAEAQRIPVATVWKAQDVFDNRSGLYAGHIGFGTPAGHRKILAEADLIIAAGTRLGDVASLNYTFPRAPEPLQKLVHIYPDNGPIGRVFRTDLGIVAEPAALLEALGQRVRVASSAREAWISSVHGFIRGFMAFTSPNPDDGVDFGEAIMALAEFAPEDAVITTDAGNISTWVHRHYPMTPKNLLIGVVGGAMGFGVPTAVAASLAAPHRMAITVVGLPWTPAALRIALYTLLPFGQRVEDRSKLFDHFTRTALSLNKLGKLGADPFETPKLSVRTEVWPAATAKPEPSPVRQQHRMEEISERHVACKTHLRHLPVLCHDVSARLPANLIQRLAYENTCL